jgi:energy-coupling factor transporter ATP-binding protein EcfA2
MKLERFRVTNFRSVDDSGWVEADAVTALIGVNESGKTNLLLPLWKLNPARDGDIEPTSDYPKIKFGEIREAPGRYRFVEAEFEAGALATKLAKATGLPEAEVAVVNVSRFFDGAYRFRFPAARRAQWVDGRALREKILGYAASIESAKALKQEAEFHAQLPKSLREIAADVGEDRELGASQIEAVLASVSALIPTEPAKTSSVVPLIVQLKEDLSDEIAALRAPDPGEVEEVKTIVREALPKFVYYSNYGNLDSEIYLPHVVENLTRPDLGTKEAAKTRTLRVLFEFVRLKAQEILELGQDFRDPNGRRPTDEELEKIAEAKKTRSILLQSAGATLTTRFRDWWKQGDYQFRFEADGNHFRIWVKDDRRPTEVELENRSTGLQWFLSFYLVFLVESQGEHRRAVLLLDEPGMSLHPLAQRDLSAFFENLSATNQLIYTSHSPFLVDADRLERARKVYVAADGTTKATPNLRHSEGRDEQKGAAYAVHSALNLSVAESLLVGCQPVLVEGPSDQHYLTTIKSLLVSAGRIKPSRELVFPPSGGTKTARVVASILTGRDETLPKILLDADAPGRKMAAALRSELYAEAPDRVLSVDQFVGFADAEVEDLFPAAFLADEIDRMVRDPDERLTDVIKDDRPFVGQVEAWVVARGHMLDAHWKVELAIKAKQRALNIGPERFDRDILARWERLFSSLI